jgi:hypothetical protein
MASVAARFCVRLILVALVLALGYFFYFVLLNTEGLDHPIAIKTMRVSEPTEILSTAKLNMPVPEAAEIGVKDEGTYIKEAQKLEDIWRYANATIKELSAEDHHHKHRDHHDHHDLHSTTHEV